MSAELSGSHRNLDYEAERSNVVVEAFGHAGVEADDLPPIRHLLLLQALWEVVVLDLADLLTSARDEGHVEDVSPGVGVTSVCNDL